MKTFGSKRMGWVSATLALLALSLALATPKGFLVSAEAAEEGLKAATDAAAQGLEVKGGEAGGADDSGDDDGDEPTPGGTVQVLTEEDFERVTQVATGATTGDWFVEFYAPWCGHCRKLDGTWTELAEKLGGQVNVGKVDATSNKALVKRFGVKGFPTLLFFSHGKVYKYARPRKLENLLEFATGGFKEDESLPVPAPPSIGGGVQDMLSKVLEDLKGLKSGKSPTPVTVLALSGSLLVLVFVFTMMKAAKPSPPKTKGE